MSKEASKEAILLDAAFAVLVPIASKYGLRDSSDFARRLSSIPVNSPEKTVTMNEAAARLCVDRRTIYVWIKQGKIACSRINSRVVRIPESAIINLIGGRQ